MGRAIGPSRFRNWKADHRANTINEWRSASVDLLANVVCKTCNGGWMSALENEEAIPAMKSLIIEDTPDTLSPRRIISIAAFTFKTAVIMDAMMRQQEPFFSANTRYRFVSSLDMPDGLQMWIGRFSGANEWHGSICARYFKYEGSAMRNFRSYALTYSAGHLVIQMVAMKRIKGKSNRSSSFPQLTQADMWTYFARRFWPNFFGSAVRWPPLYHLDEESIKIFGNRWSAPFIVRD